MSGAQHGMLLTVVVCTCDRWRLLCNCLESLARQDASPDRYEVLVVDNGSADTTAEVVSRYQSGYQHFRCVHEEKAGLSHARNRGWREAKGRYIAYIDDDAEAPPNWISSMVSFIVRHPETAVFGGPYAAFSTEPVPEWFPPEYGSMDRGEEERALCIGREFLSGTNMIFRKDVLSLSGGFNPDLGMKGAEIRYGEETRLQIELRDIGFEIYYAPSVKVRHLIDRKKISLAWLIQSEFEVGRCSLETFGERRSLFSCLCGICYGCFHAVHVFFSRWRIPLKRKVYYCLNPLVAEIGALCRTLELKRACLKTSRATGACDGC